MTGISPPVPHLPITDDRMVMQQSYMQWTQDISQRIPIRGDGSPEGVVSAPQYTEYIDRTGTTGSIKWIKMLPNIAGDVKAGWVLE
jgi:hypothetical protein